VRVTKANQIVVPYRLDIKDSATPSQAVLKHSANNENVAHDNLPADRLVDPANQRCV